ncbi:Scr1 family TA system antitoxin-like transcriptional regulator [Saccharopolyspora sp.]|uniref:Scr1 family TA system antitoxin-like transcriptional regulator n=1 Tax=Saccharopolyspora sp. TaxID=33915 RepID=UPI00345D8061
MRSGAGTGEGAPDRAFRVLQGAPIVPLAHYSSAVFLHESADTAAYRSATDALRSLAMTPGESAGLIARAVEEMESEG